MFKKEIKTAIGGWGVWSKRPELGKLIKKLKLFIIGDEATLIRYSHRFFCIDEKRIIDKTLNKNKQNLKLVLIFAIAVLVLSLLKEIVGISPYNTNEKGEVISITREEPEEYEDYDLKLQTEKEEKEATLSFAPIYEEKAEGNESSDMTLDDYIDETLTEIEGSTAKVVRLPDELQNGMKITWTEGKNNNLIMGLLISVLLIALLSRTKYYGLKKARKTSEAEIIMGLPGLVNKIVLIWQSGATFEEAVKKAIETYEYNTKNFLSKNLVCISEQVKKDGTSIILGLKDFACRTQLKDFMRITEVMYENQYKGSFLLDKLQMEREILWLKRKKQGEERGKLAETKLVFPTAMLLVVLIIVTAAPAFMQM